MVRSVLRGIRVDSLKELKERLSQYLNQLNEKPVLFTWRYKMEEMDEMPVESQSNMELIRNRCNSDLSKSEKKQLVN